MSLIISESDIANITKKIVAQIEDIGTDIYQASLSAEALQNANRSKTKAYLLGIIFR